nr:craniofacial development protein 2-like [Nicotiana tomentosiformis]
MDRFKLWYSGGSRNKNGVGILVDRKLREKMVEVRRVNDKMIMIKLVVRRFTLNIISTYAPQSGLSKEVKKLDEVARDIPLIKKLFIGENFNCHIRTTSGGYDDVYKGFGFRVRNEGGVLLLDFAETFELVVSNSSFLKKEEHLVTLCSTLAKTQIDYLLLMKGDRTLCKDYNVTTRGVRNRIAGVVHESRTHGQIRVREEERRQELVTRVALCERVGVYAIA